MDVFKTFEGLKLRLFKNPQKPCPPVLCYFIEFVKDHFSLIIPLRPILFIVQLADIWHSL